ncbi:MAG TPA: arginine--tRNA ligase [Planctomycetota bacterium]|nr:arginine--tRNA ligase [Planctomycetota bacterium]
MSSIKQELVNLIIRQAGLSPRYVAASLGKSARPELGDYSLACFHLAKEKKTPPEQLAQKIAAAIKPVGLIEKVTVVYGYVNIFLNNAKVIEIVLKEELQIPQAGAGKTVVIDYSSPNIAKPFGIGHLRSTVIGNALYKIYSALGYKCVGINYLGDWGTQFGHVLDGLGGGQITDKEIDSITNKIMSGEINTVDLSTHYSTSASSINSDNRENARKIFQRLESDDPTIKRFWASAKERSIKEFQRIYDLLGVTFDEYSGEADTNKYLAQTIEDIKSKGLTEISEGALVVKLDKHKMPPCLLRKSDGATLYAARDIAAAIKRYEKYQFHKLIYVVGADQKLHFRQVFKVLELMGYEWAKDCLHVDFGLVRFKGEKMSTRKGTAILLEDVLSQAIERSETLMKARSPELADKVSPEETKTVARAVGIGAIIFNDLKNKRIKDVDFDWDQVLTFEGETGPYLQYTHTRLTSILEKYALTNPKSQAGLDSPVRGNDKGGAKFDLLNTTEEAVLIKFLKDYPDIIRQSAEESEPSILSNYLLALASLFNKFYQMHRVISDNQELTQARIVLVHRLKEVFNNGLVLLGITPLEKM